MDFGRRFKLYRQKANLTQKEAALKIGIKDYQLANYETNRGEPSLEILKRMSQLYKVSIDKMLGNTYKAGENVFNEDEYTDPDELLKQLNEIVDKMNKANKK